MRAALISEFRKILTVRSSYVVALIIVALVGTVSVANLLQLRATDTLGSDAVSQTVYAAISIAAQLAAVFAIILMGHEYRYNLIFHTITANKSRSHILLAKIITILLYSLLVSLLAAGMAYAVASVALGVVIDSPPDQILYFGEIARRGAIYAGAFSLIGLLLALLFRTIVAPIVIIILVPSTLEPLLGLLLDDYEKFLPFASIQRLVLPGMEVSVAQSAITISTYLIIGWVAGWYLFYKRDASKQ